MAEKSEIYFLFRTNVQKQLTKLKNSKISGVQVDIIFFNQVSLVDYSSCLCCQENKTQRKEEKMAALPLTIRKAIRDNEPKLQQHLATINAATGKEFVVEVDWAYVLYSTYQRHLHMNI